MSHLTAIRPIQSLLIAIFVLMAGAGAVGALVGVRLDAAGVDTAGIGAVATAYFGGLALGARHAHRILGRVGHIRAFAAFVALLSASTLLYGIQAQPFVWAALRLVDGVCLAGVFVCLESWLNDRADPRVRGGVLAAYMVALYTGQGLGQFLLDIGETSPQLPFALASVLISLSILPITLTRGASPSLATSPALPLRRLYAISPLGLVGAAVTGAVLGAFYGLGAVYARRVGMDLAAIAAFMSSAIIGGVALQWPLGWLSDRFDRRHIILGVFAAAGAWGLLIALSDTTGFGQMVLGGVFGGLFFALYPLCVAHTNDHLHPDQRMAASGGLVLVYAAGAAAGPVLAAGAMSVAGPAGLFGFISACAFAAAAFGLWRVAARQPVPLDLQQPYQLMPRTTPMSATLHPAAAASGAIPTEEPA